MDHWLVCFAASLPPEARTEIVLGAGARLPAHSDPVPLGDEVVIQVDADPNAVAALRARKEVLGVYPDSELTLY